MANLVLIIITSIIVIIIIVIIIITTSIIVITVKLKVEGRDWKSLFALDSYTGQLTTAATLDRFR